MKMVILNGSPRKKGATASMIEYLQERLQGEVIRIDSYTASVSPCIDCRYCYTHKDCALKDNMLELYHHINEADAIILASPIYFGQLTGSLLSLTSRFQYFWTNQSRIAKKSRFGAVILVDGGMGIFEDALKMGKRLLHLLGIQTIKTIYHSGTDQPELEHPLENEKVRQELNQLIQEIKEFHV